MRHGACIISVALLQVLNSLALVCAGIARTANCVVLKLEDSAQDELSPEPQINPSQIQITFERSTLQAGGKQEVTVRQMGHATAGDTRTLQASAVVDKLREAYGSGAVVDWAVDEHCSCVRVCFAERQHADNIVQNHTDFGIKDADFGTWGIKEQLKQLKSKSSDDGGAIDQGDSVQVFHVALWLCSPPQLTTDCLISSTLATCLLQLLVCCKYDLYCTKYNESTIVTKQRASSNT